MSCGLPELPSAFLRKELTPLLDAAIRALLFEVQKDVKEGRPPSVESPLLFLARFLKENNPRRAAEKAAEAKRVARQHAERSASGRVGLRSRHGRRRVVFSPAVAVSADWQPRKIDKTAEEEASIRSMLAENPLFVHLDGEQVDVVVGAMEGCSFTAGDKVLTEGEEGDNLYLIEDGTVAVLAEKARSRRNPDGRLADLGRGSCFGELALMYDAPRAATVVATAPLCLWAIDRTTFKQIMQGTTSRRRVLYERFLGEVGILSTLKPYERLTLADALEPVLYRAGDIILEEGSSDTKHFFIVKEGEVKCTKVIDGRVREVSRRLRAGDYFGELALLYDRPRGASVTAVADTQCLRIGRKTFKRLLGPVELLLRRNVDAYRKFEAMLG
eukprot:PLAT14773.1.p1 GENE.PLAT14773.1~~PLAT14773.1.p1  ORF type:complete len:386 (-),score=142.50 PLAT14773.1:1040-2197(-)